MQDATTDTSETIDALLRVPGFAAYQGATYRGIVDILLDSKKLRRTGVRIGDLPLDFGLIEDKRNGAEEIIAVANVLALQGHSKATLIKDDRPDFTVNMPAGLLGIEHTRAFTGYQYGSEEHLHRGIQDLRADPVFRAQIGDLSISLVVDRSPIYRTPQDVLEDPDPQGFMGNRDVSNMINEIRNLSERGFFQGLVGKGRQPIIVDGTPTLAKFRATVDVDEAVSEDSIGVNVVVAMWKPGHLSLFAACVVNIKDKTKKSSKYPVMPDWLVIQVVAPPDVFIYDLGDHEMKSLGIFKKVFVLYPHIDGRLYLATYTAETDEAIRAEIPELPRIEETYDDALHEWAASVERILEPRRIRAILAAQSDANVPKMTSSPCTVEWYRKWTGRNPWVTCKNRGDRVRMSFWTAGDWHSRQTEDARPDDIDHAANRIWDFIFPGADATF